MSVPSSSSCRPWSPLSLSDVVVIVTGQVVVLSPALSDEAAPSSRDAALSHPRMRMGVRCV